MGRKRGKRKGGVEVFDSDDERAYAKEKIPDPKSSDYYHDEVDEFHINRDKIALQKENVDLLPTGWSSDEEVLGFSSDESDEDQLIAQLQQQKTRQKIMEKKSDMASDVESDGSEDADDDTAHMQSWGNRASLYGTDKHKKNIDEYSDSEPNEYDLEEASALAMQRRQAALINEQEFEMEFAQMKEVVESNAVEGTIATDFSKLSRKEKWQLIKKESPELLPLIEKYEATQRNVKENLLPLLECIKQRQLRASPKFLELLKEKIHISLDFCINVSFYFVLKVTREANIQSHPVIRRMVQFQVLLKQLETLSESFEAELATLLDNMKKKKFLSPAEMAELEESSYLNADNTSESRKRKKVEDQSVEKRKKSKTKVEIPAQPDDEDDDEDDDSDQESSDDDGDEEEDEQVNDEDVDDDADENEGEVGRRAVTKKILKNRGLTPHRKKENKNPRVKHRMKYRKAKIRRRGQVREVRRELTPYGGEVSGIRAGVKRGIRLKA